MIIRTMAATLAASVCAWILAFPSGASGQQVPTTLIGILEDNPGLYAGNPHYRDVRVVFRREKTGWFALPNNCPDERCLKSVVAKFPAQVRWTIAFDGKQLGQVVTRTPPSFDFYSTIGQETVVGSTIPPTIGKPSGDFAGFLGEPVFRPLVAISESNYRDPEDWKPTRLSTDATAAVRKAFRNRFSKVANCSKQDIEHPKPWSYTDASVRVDKVFASNRHWLIAEVALSGNECDGPSEDEAFSSQWFVITPEQRVRFLDSNMWLVDAGDYDNDGRSELVFSIADYDLGGYKLFYDDFNRNSVFKFSYH